MIQALSHRTPRELVTLGLCVLAIATAAIVVYVVKPFWLAQQSLEEKVTSLQSTNNADAPGGDAIAGLEGEVARLRQVVQGDSGNLPTQEIESFVIGRLQTIAWRHGLHLRSMEPSKGELTDDYQELLFQVTLSGGYFELGGWLRDVNQELGFVVVREFQLSEKGREASEPVLSARFLLSSYRMHSAVT